MNLILEKIISIEEFSRIANSQARTLSRGYSPRKDARAYVYSCIARDFLSSNTYLVRFVDSHRTKILTFNDPCAQPITIAEFCANPIFVESVLKDWYKPAIGSIDQADLIVFHCIGCDRRIVIDGVHRIVWIGANCRMYMKLRVTELSGRDWPPDTPDMNIVCSCSMESG